MGKTHFPRMTSDLLGQTLECCFNTELSLVMYISISFSTGSYLIIEREDVITVQPPNTGVRQRCARGFNEQIDIILGCRYILTRALLFSNNPL